jgi:hypothetical protein
VAIVWPRVDTLTLNPAARLTSNDNAQVSALRYVTDD